MLIVAPPTTTFPDSPAQGAPYGAGTDRSRAGCWDIMSDIFHYTTFLGRHRHKNGWLDVSITSYLSESPQEQYITLSPLSGRYGLSMIVLPIDDPPCPSKVFVVELAQPMKDATSERQREGVLVYSVNSTVPTGQSPTVVHRKPSARVLNKVISTKRPMALANPHRWATATVTSRLLSSSRSDPPTT